MGGGGGRGENGRALKIFFLCCRTLGALKGQKGWGGSSLITVVYHILVSCLKLGPEFFSTDQNGCEKNRNAISLGPGNFFGSKVFPLKK